MLTNPMRKIHRERRRLALVILTVFGAMWLSRPETGSLAPVVVALLAGGLTALIALAAPRLRRSTETAALASLACAGVARTLPGSALDAAGPQADWAVIAAIWIGLVALMRGLRHAALRLPLPRLHAPRFKARAGSAVDIYRLWYGLVPTPGMAARYGDPDLVAIEEMSLRLGRVRMVTQVAPEAPRETHLQIIEIEAPFHVRMRTSEADRRGVMAATGVSEIFLVDLGRRRLVLFTHEFPEMSLARACRAWLDDTPGRMLDRRLETIERRARHEDAGRPVPTAGPRRATTVADWTADAMLDADTAQTDREPGSRVSSNGR